MSQTVSDKADFPRLLVTKPNTGHEPRLEVGAQRTLESVSSMPWLGGGFSLT